LHMACERRNVKLVHYILDPAYTMQGGERDKAAVLLTGFAEVGACASSVQLAVPHQQLMLAASAGCSR